MSIEDRFREFDRAHPDVFNLFVNLAMDLRRQGVQHYSADAICHVIRWFKITSGKDDSGFKINNNYTAFYARKAMAEVPALDGMFLTRERRAA
jgi:hypothetical protein